MIHIYHRLNQVFQRLVGLVAVAVMMVLAACQDAPAPPTGPDLVADEAVGDVSAEVSVRFIESAPKDRFIIENTSSCSFDNVLFTVDLSETAGQLIFDTTASGAGVEVFQPFETVAGQLELVSSNDVNDGDTGLTVRIADLQPGSRAGFSIDVDDTLTSSELGMIRVTDSEISGGLVRIEHADQPAVTATFDSDSNALLSIPCTAN